MEEYTFLAPLLLTIGGLIIGAILKSLLKHSRLPYTVGLFAIGIILGVMNRTGVFQSLPELHDAVSSVANINPDLILYLFLPILIFDAAYELNLHIFKKTLANATLLSAPGLIICMLLTGALMMGVATFLPGFESWTWAFALMFGALISATDPVAVVALLHELKTSKRFSTLVDAESLLNDGTGIVCFMLFFGAYAAEEATHASPVITFIREVGLSTLLGFLLARIVIWFITRINSEEMVQNSVIILAAYLTFILSQYYLGVSGVIALVAFGLTVTYVGKPRLKPQVNTFMEHFWELLTYIANTLIFILVGVVIAEKVDFSWGALGVLILIYIALNFIRFAMIILLYPVMKRLGIRTDPTRIGHPYLGRITWCIGHDLGPDGILYPGYSGGHPQPGIVLHGRHRYPDTLHQCHHHARTAEPLGTDSRTFCTHHVGLSYREINTREFRKISGRVEKERRLRRSQLAQSGKLHDRTTAGAGQKSTKQSHAAGNPSACIG